MIVKENFSKKKIIDVIYHIMQGMMILKVIIELKIYLLQKKIIQEDLDKDLLLAVRSCAGSTLLWFNHKPSLTSFEICQMLINAGANVNYKSAQLEQHLKIYYHLLIAYFACLWRDYRSKFYNY